MDGKATWRRPGFTLPGLARAAAQKGHSLGLLHRWTPDEARAMAARGGATRAERVRDLATRGVTS